MPLLIAAASKLLLFLGASLVLASAHGGTSAVWGMFMTDKLQGLVTFVASSIFFMCALPCIDAYEHQQLPPRPVFILACLGFTYTVNR